MRIGNLTINTKDFLSIIWFLENKSEKSYKDSYKINGYIFEIFVEKGNSSLFVQARNVPNYKFNILNEAYEAAQLFLDKLLFTNSQASYIDYKESTIVFFSY